MNRVSHFLEDIEDIEDDLVDGGDDELAMAARGAAKAAVSHEFVQYQAKGLAAFCWAPWRMLKIDIRSRTSVCCAFAHRLPPFDWPTAKTFHEESRMWNHPYMRHMRRTMGKKDELPFCTICRESDKRDNKNADARREAMRTTQDIYNGFLERIEAARARGSVERYATDPGAFVVRLSAEVNATVLQPIVRQRSSFRKLTRTRGFAQCERVLQIGSLNGGVTPYLAESAAVVTVVDFRRSALDRIQGIAHALGFDNVKVTLIQSAAALPFDDASFDGIWLNGRLLTLAGRRLVLSEARRLLAPGGRVSAVQCLGPGGVIEQVANGRLGAADAAAAFAGGVAFDRRGSFMTSITVLAALKGSGLVSDRERPPAGTRFDGDPGAPNLRTDFADLARYLEPGNRPAGFFNKTEALHGVERFVAFTATKEEPAERARNSH